MRKEQSEQHHAIEVAYRRGYHHGLSKTQDLIFGLLDSGLPKSVVVELCHVFEPRKSELTKIPTLCIL